MLCERVPAHGQRKKGHGVIAWGCPQWKQICQASRGFVGCCSRAISTESSTSMPNVERQGLISAKSDGGPGNPHAKRQSFRLFLFPVRFFPSSSSCRGKNPHAMIVDGFADRRQLLDRIHVAERRVGQCARNPGAASFDRSHVKWVTPSPIAVCQQSADWFAFTAVDDLPGNLITNNARRDAACADSTKMEFLGLEAFVSSSAIC